MLLVGNHSGGNMTPDTIVFTLAFSTYFGVERPFYQLAHNLVLASPYGQILRKYGTVAASHEHARKALEDGAALLVYPGGDWEVHRPVWEANRVDFAGRKGFIRLALDAGVPIVPVVSIGGQETSLFLSRGAGLARALGVDRTLRLKVLPISLALPWVVNIGDFLGHIPLPAKITTEVLPPIDIVEQFGDEPDFDEVYDHVVRVMQECARLARRRAPLPGDRLGPRCASTSRSRSRRRSRSSGTTSPSPTHYLHFMSGVTRWEPASDHRSGLGARYRMLIRVGAAEVGGLIEFVEWRPETDMAWTSVTGHRPARPLARAQRPRRPHAGRASLRLRRRRRRDHGADRRASRRALDLAPSAAVAAAAQARGGARAASRRGAAARRGGQPGLGGGSTTAPGRVRRTYAVLRKGGRMTASEFASFVLAVLVALILFFGGQRALVELTGQRGLRDPGPGRSSIEDRTARRRGRSRRPPIDPAVGELRSPSRRALGILERRAAPRAPARARPPRRDRVEP